MCVCEKERDKGKNQITQPQLQKDTKKHQSTSSKTENCYDRALLLRNI